MSEKNPFLLPSGLYDLLPPDAARESDAVARLLAAFESFGYEQVSPPLMEFEASLLAEGNGALASRTFRVMDPLSHAMMGVRADMTLQIARIARSRLTGQPRPLRLCYAGPTLQAAPEPLQHERQLTQAGIELIGVDDSIAADAEVINVAAEALSLLGVKGITVDINLPGLLARLCPEAYGNPELQAQIRDAVSRKDAASIARLPVVTAGQIAALADAAGPVDAAVAKMKALGVAEAQPLAELAARLREACPDVTLTLDPVEYRGIEYHRGISFSIFAAGLRHELGRGGRYETEGGSATGFTLYATYLLDLLAAPPRRKRLLLAPGFPAARARALRAEGWATVQALGEHAQDEARKLGCTHLTHEGEIKEL